jgi:hypothetical protein
MEPFFNGLPYQRSFYFKSPRRKEGMEAVRVIKETKAKK